MRKRFPKFEWLDLNSNPTCFSLVNTMFRSYVFPILCSCVQTVPKISNLAKQQLHLNLKKIENSHSFHC